jgi:hypothetical protein
MLLTGHSAPAGAATSTTAVLRWTATGNDSTRGTAKRYDIRRSTIPLTIVNFLLGDSLASPVPAVAGMAESLRVTIPIAGVLYYFAIRAVDASGNWSLISNVAAWTAPILGTRSEEFGPASLSAAWPNPARAATNWTLSTPHDDEVLAEVYDSAGRRITVLDTGPRQAGPRTIKWDLHSDAGGGVAPGVYWVRVRVPDHQFVRQVVITH